MVVKKRTLRNRSKVAPSKKKKAAAGRKKKKIFAARLKVLMLISLECLGLTIIGMASIIVFLGYISKRFSGTDLLNHLLPFAGGILGLIILVSLFLSIWKRLRRWLQGSSPHFPAAIVLALCLLICAFIPKGYFTRAFGSYRTLVGGKEEAGRVVLAHQVYATYRRLNTIPLKKMIDRAEQFRKAIQEAATAYAIDTDLLQGLAAAESSYLPRESTDGGQGLFQLTSIPTPVLKEINERFPASKRQISDPRYNAFIGAATLRYYLTEMNEDLFLGLLAYNIGPANGGLRFIMQQYGVNDFTTIQPYLLQLPRDYPIRVLSYALAFRIERKEGRLLAYEKGKNAHSIQALGIPGL